jgi:hypothetical protein
MGMTIEHGNNKAIRPFTFYEDVFSVRGYGNWHWQGGHILLEDRSKHGIYYCGLLAAAEKPSSKDWNRKSEHKTVKAFCCVERRFHELGQQFVEP